MVMYRGEDGGIIELSLYGYWYANSLSAHVASLGYAVPPAAGDPVALSYGPNVGDIVVYRANNGHIYAFEFIVGTWVGKDLNAVAGAPAAANAVGEPSVYLRWDFETNTRTTVVYRSADGHIHELRSTGFYSWAWRDLTAAAAAPAAASDPTVMKRPVWLAQANSVVYRGNDNHIYELSSPNPDAFWSVSDVPANAVRGLQYLAAGKPQAHVRADGVPTIMYRMRIDVPYGSNTVTTTYRLVELSLNVSASVWTANDVTTMFQLPASLSDPRPYERQNNTTAIPFYGPRGNVYEMRLNGTWSVAKL